CLIRECACLPACLLREYFSVNEGGLMKSTRQIISATIVGFISLMFLISILEKIILSFYPNSPATPPEIMLLQIIINGIFFGIFIGGAIGYALSIKTKATMMAICGLAYLAPIFLFNPMVLGLPNFWLYDGWDLFYF